VVEAGVIVWLSEVAVEAVQPEGEPAEQEVELVELQVNVLEPPAEIAVGLGVRETVGAGLVEVEIGISNRYSDPGSSVLVKLVEDVDMLAVGMLPTGVFSNI
jgi:hypothetical protein